jgi:type IV pilus assembly protein PilE
MRKFLQTQAGSEAGFTLVELMVVIVIASILVAISVPSYLRQSREAHRTEAKTTLLDLAGREERLMSTKGIYSLALSTDLGYSSATTPSGYYTISISNVNPATAPVGLTPGTPATFLLTATATGNQTKDTPCQTFTVDSTGVQASLPATTGCW